MKCSVLHTTRGGSVYIHQEMYQHTKTAIFCKSKLIKIRNKQLNYTKLNIAVTC